MQHVNPFVEFHKRKHGKKFRFWKRHGGEFKRRDLRGVKGEKARERSFSYVRFPMATVRYQYPRIIISVTAIHLWRNLLFPRVEPDTWTVIRSAGYFDDSQGFLSPWTPSTRLRLQVAKERASAGPEVSKKGENERTFFGTRRGGGGRRRRRRRRRRRSRSRSKSGRRYTRKMRKRRKKRKKRGRRGR